MLTLEDMIQIINDAAVKTDCNCSVEITVSATGRVEGAKISFHIDDLDERPE